MKSVRGYFKEQCQWNMAGLKCERPADLYTGLWRTQSAVLPILLIRIFLFLLCVAITIASLVLTIEMGYGSTWAIFLTHWGLVVNTLACTFAVAVSAKCYFGGDIDSSESVPWYFPVFWMFYNIAVTLSFLITVFYWVFLTDLQVEDSDVDFAVDPVLDIFIHAINSVTTFVLLMTSALPARLLHVLYPVGFSIIYLIFSAIYYAAGGLSPFDTQWIYPVLDWTQPGLTMFFVLVVLILMLLLYGLVIGMTVVRDACARAFCMDKSSMDLAYYDDSWRGEPRGEPRAEPRRPSMERNQTREETNVASPITLVN